MIQLQDILDSPYKLAIVGVLSLLLLVILIILLYDFSSFDWWHNQR